MQRGLRIMGFSKYLVLYILSLTAETAVREGNQ